MKILITGGAGFIGSALARRLARDPGQQVIVADKLTYAGHMTSLAPVADQSNFQFVRADICDRGAMHALFQSYRPDAVMHLAAESHVDRSITDAADFINTNILGTFVLMEAARAHWEGLREEDARARFRFHHVSTDEVFGSLGPTGQFTELSPADPRSPYAASKAAAGHLVSAWGHTYGLPVLISNCSNNYGPYQLPEKLIALAILNALEGKTVPVYGDGQNVRDWLFVEDHVDALLAVLQKGTPGEAYNVGGRCERRNIDVAQLVCSLVGKHAEPRSRRAQIEFVPDRPGHDRRYAIDPSKIESQLGWRAQTSFEDGLERTVLWYLRNRDWWLPLRAAGHGKSRLGLGPAGTTG